MNHSFFSSCSLSDVSGLTCLSSSLSELSNSDDDDCYTISERILAISGSSIIFFTLFCLDISPNDLGFSFFVFGDFLSYSLFSLLPPLGFVFVSLFGFAFDSLFTFLVDSPFSFFREALLSFLYFSFCTAVIIDFSQFLFTM